MILLKHAFRSCYRTLQDLWDCAINAKMRARDVNACSNSFCYCYKCFCNKGNSNVCTHHGHNDDTENIPKEVHLPDVRDLN